MERAEYTVSDDKITVTVKCPVNERGEIITYRECCIEGCPYCIDYMCVSEQCIQNADDID